MVNFRDEDATERTKIICEAAQWFEDHSPVDEQFRKKRGERRFGKGITAAILGGDCYPATPIGVNLPECRLDPPRSRFQIGDRRQYHVRLCGGCQG